MQEESNSGFVFTRRTALGLGFGAAALAIGAGLFSHFGKDEPEDKPDTVYEGVLPYMASMLAPHVANASEIKDSDLMLHVQIVLADASVMSADDTIDSLWQRYNHSPDAFFGMQDIYVPIYDAGISDSYVALAWKEGMFGGVMPKDVTFARDHDMAEMISDCVFDFESGIVQIPKYLVDDYSYENAHDASCPVRAQFLLPISLDDLPEVKTHYTIVDTNGVSLADGVVVGDVWDTDLCIEYALPEADSYSFEITLDGTEEVAHVPSASTLYVPDMLSIIVPMAPACVSGVVIRILDYESPSVVSSALSMVIPRRAYGENADTMVKYGYGKIKYDPQLQEGFNFTYSGKFRYATSDQIPGARDIYNRSGIGSSLYAYYKAYLIVYESGETFTEWETSDATGSNWNSISGDVYHSKLERWYDGSRMIAPYYGELFTLLGADATSDYTFKNRDYFSSLKGPYDGIVPCGCMHQEQGNLGSAFGTFIDTTIKVRVLKVSLNANNPYIILAFATTEIQHDTVLPERWSQGGAAIYKFELEAPGYSKVVKKSSM